MTKLAQHDVKLGITEGQRLGVAFPEIDFHIREARVFARSLEQLRRKIDTAHACSYPRGGNRDHARAAGDIENILSTANILQLDQSWRRRRRQRFKRHEIFPALSLRLFEFGNGTFTLRLVISWLWG